MFLNEFKYKKKNVNSESRTSNSQNNENNGRKKRQTVTSPFNGKDTCFMYLKVDPILYNVIYANEGNNVI